MYVRRLPSGLWQATVRHPGLPRDRNRITKTSKLRREVVAWAGRLEADFAAGQLRDPRLGKITVGEWWERWFAAHVVSPGTRRGIESKGRIHILPKWGGWQMQAITRTEAKGWVRELEVTQRRTRRGFSQEEDDFLKPSMIRTTVSVMHSLFNAAMDESPPIVVSNPFARLPLPTIPPGKIVFYTREQHVALAHAAARRGQLRWQVMLDLAIYVGLRFGEIAGLPISHVNWLRKEINVWQAWTWHGIRPVPKTLRSFRTVPVPDRVIEAMSRLAQGRPGDALLFGRPLGEIRARYTEWSRVWYAIVAAARTCDDGQRYCGGDRCGASEHRLPAWSPHVLRHTAASWLVMDGVDLRRVQALFGHEKYATTERYAHLAPDFSDRIRDAWRSHDAPVTHEAKIIPLQAGRSLS